MKDDIKFQLQAHLDGELSDLKARKISEQLSKDSEARAMLAELQFVNVALRENEPEMKLPESRECCWSKIRREMERAAPQEESQPVRFPLFAWWKPAYARVASGVAAGCALLMISFIAFNSGNQANTGYLPGEVEGSGEYMGAITYHSDADQMTIVYLFDREQNRRTDFESN
jgi:anti-sigma factor RsiW